jgi:hypothetical protein
MAGDARAAALFQKSGISTGAGVGKMAAIAALKNP